MIHNLRNLKGEIKTLLRERALHLSALVQSQKNPAYAGPVILLFNFCSNSFYAIHPRLSSVCPGEIFSRFAAVRATPLDFKGVYLRLL